MTKLLVPAIEAAAARGESASEEAVRAVWAKHGLNVDRHCRA